MLIDLHIHSQFSFDSKEKIENYVKAAKMRSIPVIGFSEHYDYDAVLDGENIAPCDISSYDKYINELELKEISLGILKGIEFGYRDISVTKYRQLTAEYDFDYIINSVHTLPNRGDCFHERFFAGRPLKESYRDYLNAVLESIYADFDFQIIGHIGYVSRYR
ncbi:MAG: PHP domain-containing protein, partial [Clostridia bacterium]|nr:PHP domain-containing protein [Clostridia bacterium]